MAIEGVSPLIQVVVLLSSAVIAVPLFKRLGLGSVLGYLAAGLVIGPFGFGLFNDPHTILHIAEFGVVIFLFVVGLEMHPSHLWHLRHQIFGLGSLQVGLCTLLLTFVLMGFDIAWQSSFVGAAGFVLTSTAIVMQVLGERNELSTHSGQKIVSVLLFEDLIIVPLLVVIGFLSPLQNNSDTPIWQSLAIAIFSVVALIFIGHHIINPIFRILARYKAREVMTAAALLVVLGSSLLMEWGGLSMAMGSFIAGVLLSESSFRHQIEADVEPFRGLLLGLFFLAVGMSLDLAIVAKNWQFILLGVLVLMIVKTLAVYAVARVLKSNHKEALDRAVLMAQGGEFAFMLYTTATTQGVINMDFNANLTAMVVISMALTPLLLILKNKLPQANQTEQPEDQIDQQHSVIIAGIGRYGQVINDILRASGFHATIIDIDAKLVAGLRGYGTTSYFGNASRPELLITAGIETAKVLIIAINNRAQATQMVAFAKKINPEIKIIARAYDRFHTFDLYEVDADEIVRETFDSAIRSGKRALEMLGIEHKMAEKIGDLYFKMDRSGMAAMANLYDHKINVFQNGALLEQSKLQDQQIQLAIQGLLEGEKIDEEMKDFAEIAEEIADELSESEIKQAE